MHSHHTEGALYHHYLPYTSKYLVLDTNRIEDFFVSKLLFDDTINDTINLRGKNMENRESETVEFKKSTSELKQGIVSLSSMLNKSGSGILYFGVLNDSTIIGQQIGKDTTHDISVEIKNHIKPEVIPTVELINIGDKQIIKISVAGDKKPYSAYGRYYIRSDDEDILMSNEILEQFFKDDSIVHSVIAFSHFE